MTARHCLDYVVKQNSSHRAVSKLKLSVGSVQRSLQQAKSTEPIANVVRSTSFSNTEGGLGRSDIALLELEAVPERGYHEVPSLDMNENPLPEPGEKVAVYGFPSATSKIGQYATGRYLASVDYAKDKLHQQYGEEYVGLRVTNARNEPTEHGGSGGLAIGMSSGHIFGPLYSSSGTPQLENRSDPNDYGIPATEQLKRRLVYEQNTNIDMTDFPVVAIYSDKPAGSLSMLAKSFERSAKGTIVTNGY